MRYVWLKRSMKAFTQLEKLPFYYMFLCPFNQCQRDKFRVVNGVITRGVRTIMVNHFAQVQTPIGLTDTKCERRYQMCDHRTLKGWF